MAPHCVLRSTAASHSYWSTVRLIESVCGWPASSTVPSSPPLPHCCKQALQHTVCGAPPIGFSHCSLNLPSEHLKELTLSDYSSRVDYYPLTCQNRLTRSHTCSIITFLPSSFPGRPQLPPASARSPLLCSRSLLFPSHGPLSIRLLHSNQLSGHLPPQL